MTRPGTGQSTSARLAELLDVLAETCAELAAVTHERDLYAQALADLRPADLIVARDGGRDCSRCDAEILRGQAYHLRGVDDLEHALCPDLTDVDLAPVVTADVSPTYL